MKAKIKNPVIYNSATQKKIVKYLKKITKKASIGKIEA